MSVERRSGAFTWCCLDGWIGLLTAAKRSIAIHWRFISGKQSRIGGVATKTRKEKYKEIEK